MNSYVNVSVRACMRSSSCVLTVTHQCNALLLSILPIGAPFTRGRFVRQILARMSKQKIVRATACILKNSYVKSLISQGTTVYITSRKTQPWVNRQNAKLQKKLQDDEKKVSTANPRVPPGKGV